MVFVTAIMDCYINYNINHSILSQYIVYVVKIFLHTETD